MAQHCHQQQEMVVDYDYCEYGDQSLSLAYGGDEYHNQYYYNQYDVADQQQAVEEEEDCSGWYLDAQNVKYYVDHHGIEYYADAELDVEDAEAYGIPYVWDDNSGVPYYAEEELCLALKRQFADINRFGEVPHNWDPYEHLKTPADADADSLGYEDTSKVNVTKRDSSDSITTAETAEASYSSSHPYHNQDFSSPASDQEDLLVIPYAAKPEHEEGADKGSKHKKKKRTKKKNKKDTVKSNEGQPSSVVADSSDDDVLLAEDESEQTIKRSGSPRRPPPAATTTRTESPLDHSNKSLGSVFAATDETETSDSIHPLMGFKSLNLSQEELYARLESVEKELGLGLGEKSTKKQLQQKHKKKRTESKEQQAEPADEAFKSRRKKKQSSLSPTPRTAASRKPQGSKWSLLLEKSKQSDMSLASTIIQSEQSHQSAMLSSLEPHQDDKPERHQQGGPPLCRQSTAPTKRTQQQPRTLARRTNSVDQETSSGGGGRRHSRASSRRQLFVEDHHQLDDEEKQQGPPLTSENNGRRCRGTAMMGRPSRRGSSRRNLMVDNSWSSHQSDRSCASFRNNGAAPPLRRAASTKEISVRGTRRGGFARSRADRMSQRILLRQSYVAAIDHYKKDDDAEIREQAIAAAAATAESSPDEAAEKDDEQAVQDRPVRFGGLGALKGGSMNGFGTGVHKFGLASAAASTLNLAASVAKTAVNTTVNTATTVGNVGLATTQMAAGATMMVGKTAANVGLATTQVAAGATMLVAKTAVNTTVGAAKLAVDTTVGVGGMAVNSTVGAANTAVNATKSATAAVGTIRGPSLRRLGTGGSQRGQHKYRYAMEDGVADDLASVEFNAEEEKPPTNGGPPLPTRTRQITAMTA